MSSQVVPQPHATRPINADGMPPVGGGNGDAAFYNADGATKSVPVASGPAGKVGRFDGIEGGSIYGNSPIMWRFRDIKWGAVFRNQLWATAVVTIIPVAMLGVIHWAIHPRIRPYYPYDATISYPFHKDTFPTWVAIVLPFALMLISLFIGEFILFKKVHRNITNATSTVLHFFIDLVVAFLFTIFMTELTKVAVGRLRPDFLSQCNPQTLPLDYKSAIGLDGQATQRMFPCTVSRKVELDLRQSFVSGHASSATVFAFYHCGYFLWTLFYRDRTSTMAHVVSREGKRGVWLKDMGQALAMYWVLVQICVGWGIGISRIIDNKHHPADVIGGFVLGALIGLAFVLKAIPTAKYVVGRGPQFNMTHSFSMRHGLAADDAVDAAGGSAARPGARAIDNV